MNSITCRDYIFQNLSIISFKDTIVKPYPRDIYDFSYKKIYKRDDIIDVNKVVGTDHPDYRNKTWLEVLHNLKRSSNLDNLFCFEKNNRINVKYYTDTEHRKKFLSDTNWTIDVMNNSDLYISEGNHRTTIAKFLAATRVIPPKISIPHVNYYFWDERAFQSYRVLQRTIERMNTFQDNQFHILLKKKQNLIKRDAQEDNTVIEEYEISYKLNIWFDDYNEENYEGFFKNISDVKAFLFKELKKHQLGKNNYINKITNKLQKFIGEVLMELGIKAN